MGSWRYAWRTSNFGRPRRASSVALAAFAALAAFGAGAAHATTITFNGFSNTNGLTTAGSTTTTTTGDGTVLRIVSASGGQAGAAYSESPITLGANATFSTQFQFRFTNPGGIDPADGMTFVLAASPTGLGSTGAGIGYAGVANSVAVEFDTYNNGNVASYGYSPSEPDSSNHVAIDTNGVLSNTAATNVYGVASCGFSNGIPVQNTYTAAGCMANGDLWTVNVSYNGSLLNVSLSDPAEGAAFNAISDYPIDIGSYLGSNTAYVGFTGSDGSGWENEDVVNWQFANTLALATVPEPHSLVLVAVGLLGLGLARRHKRAGSIPALT